MQVIYRDRKQTNSCPGSKGNELHGTQQFWESHGYSHYLDNGNAFGISIPLQQQNT
jgi:hypothetical protein